MSRTLLSVACLLMCLMSRAGFAQSIPSSASRTNDQAFTRFDDAIKRYVRLVEQLHREVPELRVTNKSAEISNRSDMLAGAVERARRGAAQGNLFDPDTARVIKARLAAALRGASVAALLKDINDEKLLTGPPRVHLRFPVEKSLATMPPQLLAELPRLPGKLEYRFVGRALVVRDRDAALILDFLPDALPQP